MAQETNKEEGKTAADTASATPTATTPTPAPAAEKAPPFKRDSHRRMGGDRGGPGGRRGQRGGRGKNDDASKEDQEFSEKIVFINRCAKVVKGGRRFSFSALLVSGDGKGKAGIGFGKANEVSEAIRKAGQNARREMNEIRTSGSTIPHEVIGEFGGARVLLKPASKGTGLIAGGGVRAVVESAGIQDILGKSLGSGNPSNVVRATMDALKQLRTKEEIFRARGKALAK
ncbi:MAG: 30S ribosomal protein S5 [Verrucomicrobiota bacterium]